jgi:hypothetical protein
MTVVLTPVLIANGTALSAAVPLGPKELQGISMPATWSPAAGLTFQVSIDGVTFQTLTDATGAPINYGVAAGVAGALGGLYLAVDPTLWRGITFIKIQSSTSTGGIGAINQGADRILNLVTQ